MLFNIIFHHDTFTKLLALRGNIILSNEKIGRRDHRRTHALSLLSQVRQHLIRFNI